MSKEIVRGVRPSVLLLLGCARKEEEIRGRQSARVFLRVGRARPGVEEGQVGKELEVAGLEVNVERVLFGRKVHCVEGEVLVRWKRDVVRLCIGRHE